MWIRRIRRRRMERMWSIERKSKRRLKDDGDDDDDDPKVV